MRVGRTVLVRRLVVVLAGGAAFGAAVVPIGEAVVPGTSQPEGSACSTVVDMSMDPRPVSGENLPYEALGIDAAHQVLERGRTTPGEGVTVVIIDSGAAPSLVDQQELLARDAEITSPHGSVVAGIIGGAPAGDVPIGLAQGADLVSLKVYDQGYDAATDSSVVTPSSDAVTAGLAWVRTNRRQLSGGDHLVALVPTTVARSSELEDEVRALHRAGVLVVAASGDRPPADSRSPLERYAFGEEGAAAPGENALGDAWPADFESVLSVGVAPTEEEVTGFAVQNSGIDVAAPVQGGVSYGPNGKPCVVTAPSTEYAAAYVAGVAALVWSGRPGDSAAELRERLVRTANGSEDPEAVSRVTGAGVVQPVEALQRRDLTSSREDPGSDVAQRAEPPGARADLLASTRRNALWWGLVGFAALVIALLLRPVLARRREC